MGPAAPELDVAFFSVDSYCVTAASHLAWRACWGGQTGLPAAGVRNMAEQAVRGTACREAARDFLNETEGTSKAS